MTNKPDYLNNEYNSHDDIRDFKNAEYKDIEELTEEDIFIACSGLTQAGDYKSLVEIFWDIADEKGNMNDYVSTDCRQCMVRLNKKSELINLELHFENDSEEMFEFSKMINDYFSTENSDFSDIKESSLELRISPYSLEGEVIMSMKDPILHAVGSSDFMNFNQINLVYLPEDITIGRLGEKDVKWKVESFPLNYKKNVIKDKYL